MFTRQDLKIMQNYPLHVKVGRTQARIMEFHRELGGQVYISFSGGKDSTVLLDIARKLYPDIPAVYVDTGLEYPGVRSFVRSFGNVLWLRPKLRYHQVIETYGYPVIGKEVARAIYYARRGSDWAVKKLNGFYKDGTESKIYQSYKKYNYLIGAPFSVSDQCCDIMKKWPLKKFEKGSGRHPITGTMASESWLRQTKWLQNGCNVFVNDRMMSNPLSFWTEQDILAYLLTFNLPFAPDYGEIVPVADTMQQLSFVDQPLPKLTTTGCKRTGCYACMFGVHLEKEPNRFQMLHNTYPKLYDYCINKLGCGAVMDYMGVEYRPL